MQESCTEKYCSLDARAKIEERRKAWTPELQAEAEKAWRELFADVEAALNEDPAGKRGQALAARWRTFATSPTA